MTVVTEKRGAHTKCCQVPSREGFIPVEAIKKGLMENVAFQLDPER